MLQNAQSEMTTAPWIAIFPRLMIFIVVLAVNAIGGEHQRRWSARCARSQTL
jgi:ABC-type dipeptide/oligopeptide/nickel transport system permease subunit